MKTRLVLTLLATLLAAPPTVADPDVGMTRETTADFTLTAAATGAPSTLGLLAIANGQVGHLGDVTRYAYVVVQSWQRSVVQGVHARSRSTSVLAYFEAAVAQQASCSSSAPPSYAAYDSSPVSYCWIRRYHPSWFLRDRSGRLLHFNDFPGLVALDIGNASYRALWMHNVISLAKTGAFNGVYFDDVSLWPTHGLAGRIAKYTDTQYSQAMAGFAAYAGDSLRASGLRAVANTGVDPWVGVQAQRAIAIAGHLTAVSQEHWVRWGNYCTSSPGVPFTSPYSSGNPDLATMLNFRRQLQHAGARVFGIDYSAPNLSNSDYSAMVYGRSLFLMAWDGRPGSAYFFRTCGTSDPASPLWTADPGQPTGAMRVDQSTWMRPFTKGMVLLNPSPSTTVMYVLPLLQTYKTQSGQTVSLVIRLAPHSAVILTRA